MRSFAIVMTAALLSMLINFGATAGTPAIVDSDMAPRVVGQYRVTDALYLPFAGDDRFEYPEDVLWGFYPTKASPAALDCAERAFSTLVTFLRDEPVPLEKVIDRGGTNRFVLWVNDYSRASLSRQRRTANLWHYDKRSRRDPRYGVWHWEATLSQTGFCSTPSWPKAIRRLERALEQLGD